MAYSNQEKATLLAGFNALPQNVKDLFNAKSTSDTQEAVASLIAAQRSTSMQAAVEALVTGSISDWTALAQLAAVSDSATLHDVLLACEQARISNSNTLIPLCIAFFLAARYHFRIA
jgi:hypothetical protein